MLNLQAIKSAIPLVFSFIIIGFIAKLGYDNIQLESDNKGLRSDVKQLNKKNDGLAESIKTLAEQAAAQNEIVKTESKRRAAAEMKQQRLQGEIAEMLRGDKCAHVNVPDGVADRLREQTDSIRSSKGEAATDTSKPTR
ncbi:DUF2570 domain-containing protein [Kluyvera ascorbata]|uniref:DUF2570 domain-containing protein n=1 Tax=Kluyvera ascorbata TaxID=51288 RepID=UPI00206371B8|nr:DUF2570 domain-containing protein [Kluyvera ascorbata]UPQ70549.1 DUF2570 domain-containing protein [Kluyvera ascorbata]